MGRWFEHVDTPADQGLRTITAAEVGRHSRVNDCWVIYKGHVYDLSEFLLDHPGGEDLILQFAGQDVGDVMDDPVQHAHSNSAYLLLEEYLIGKVPADYVATPHAPVPPPAAPIAGRAAGAIFAEGNPNGPTPSAPAPPAPPAPQHPAPLVAAAASMGLSPEDLLASNSPVMSRNPLAPPTQPMPASASSAASASAQAQRAQRLSSPSFPSFGQKDGKESSGLNFLKFYRRR